MKLRAVPVVELPDAAVAVAPATLDSAASVVKAAVRSVALTHELGIDGLTPLTKLTAPHYNLSAPERQLISRHNIIENGETNLEKLSVHRIFNNLDYTLLTCK